ncbi:MAG: S8 family serine peptidase [Pseudomonadota bacterium]
MTPHDRRLVSIGSALLFLAACSTPGTPDRKSLVPQALISQESLTFPKSDGTFGSQRSQAPFSPTHVVVKFKSTIALATSNASRGIATAPTASLSSLYSKYGVQRASALFTFAAPAATNAFPTVLDAVKRKFPKRTLRAPASAVAPDLSRIYVLTVPDGTDIPRTVAGFAADPAIEWAQPEYRYTISSSSLPNDTYVDPDQNGTWAVGSLPGFSALFDLWGLERIGMKDAWAITQGVGVVVAVVDTGVDYKHKEFFRDTNGNGVLDPGEQYNIWINPGEDLNHNGTVDGTDTCPIPNGDFDCVDNDGNGFVDDIAGGSFAGGSNDPMDPHGHGTHVAGTIAAVGNNALGLVGVAPKVKIMAVKALPYGNLANAVLYAALNGADIINNSWGCVGAHLKDHALEEAFTTAYSLGVVSVFAAGNDAVPADLCSPTNMTDAKPIVVAASSHDAGDAIWEHSDSGVLIDVAAPGVNILSLRASAYVGGDGMPLIVDNDYLMATGTSMAAPHVSGMAALVLALHPTLTNEEVRQILRVSARDTGTPGFDLRNGAGRVDPTAALALSSAPTVKIDTPVYGASFSSLSGTVSITGSAGGPGFQHYQLFVTDRIETRMSWIALGPVVTASVSKGSLGQFDLSPLSDGRYDLILVVKTNDGKEFLDIHELLVQAALPRLLSASASYGDPAVSGKTVVWHEFENDFSRIRAINLESNVAYWITPASSDMGAFSPAIDGFRIAWIQSDFATGNQTVHSCVIDPVSGNCPEELIPLTGMNDDHPAISGSRLVWLAKPRTPPANPTTDPESDVYLFDFANNGAGLQKITSHATAVNRVSISGTKLVWEDLRTGSSEIYLYDLSAPTNGEVRITPQDSPGDFLTQGIGLKPTIVGNRIVYQMHRGEWNGFWKIFLYDLDRAESGEQQLSEDNVAANDLAFSGRFVIWSESDGQADLIRFDLSTHKRESLTHSWEDELLPTASGDRIVYLRTPREGLGGNNSLFLWTAAARISVTPGWNLISVPMEDLISRQKVDLFPSATSSAFEYTVKGYQVASTLSPGRGYWLKFGAAETIALVGTPLSTIDVPVEKGWNIVGSVFNPIETSTVMSPSTPPIGILGSFFDYSGGYNARTQLQPGTGYWVKTDMAGVLRFSSGSTTAPLAPQLHSSTEVPAAF